MHVLQAFAALAAAFLLHVYATLHGLGGLYAVFGAMFVIGCALLVPSHRPSVIAACAGLALMALIACTHLSISGSEARVTTFGSASVTVQRPDGTQIKSEGDGTNLAALVGRIVEAARRVFSGGGDTVINVPGAAPAPAPTPEG